MIRTVLAVTVLAFGVSAVVAQGDPIAARQALMKANGDQSRIATEMLNGKRPFDLDAAKKVFIVFAESGDKAKALFPDNSKTGGDTAALPAIWEKKADFDAMLTKFANEFEGGGCGHHQSRHLQGADHRGPQELRRLPHAVPQEGLVVSASGWGQDGPGSEFRAASEGRPPIYFGPAASVAWPCAVGWRASVPGLPGSWWSGFDIRYPVGRKVVKRMSNPNSTKIIDLLVVLNSKIRKSACRSGMRMLESDH